MIYNGDGRGEGQMGTKHVFKSFDRIRFRARARVDNVYRDSN